MKPLSTLRKHPLAVCLGAALAIGPTCAAFATAGALSSKAKAPTSSRAPSHAMTALPRLSNRPAAPNGSPQVTNCNDSGPGSLRDAVAISQDGDRISLESLACSTITLTSGAIHIPAMRLTLRGPGADGLSIDGNGNDRVLLYDSGPFGTTYLYDLTITNGHAAGDGGCLKTSGKFRLTDVVVSNCAAYAASGQVHGGAIYSASDVYMLRSTVTSSTATSANDYAKGGGIYTKWSWDSTNSTVSGNSAIGPTRTFGGGVFARYGDVLGTTVNDNKAGNVGGVTFIGPGSATIANSTITGNIGQNFIGGMYSHVNLTLSNSTIAFNCANGTAYSPTYTLGIGLQAYSIAPDIESSIIAKNELCPTHSPGSVLDTAYDVGLYGVGPITGANNLIGSSTVTLPADTLHSDPMLSPLADNGGSTLTLAPLPGSPVINAGNNVANLSYDQRGPWIPRIIGSAADIGALEVQTGGTTSHVTTCADSGAGSLRELAASALSGDTIDLGGLACSRITLTSGAIELPQANIKFVGPGAASLTIDGNQQGRVLDHTGLGTLEIDGLSFENGYFQGTPAAGGCVKSASRVLANNASFTGCNARAGDGYCLGGAIYGLSVVLSHSTVSANSCGSADDAKGGGVYAKLELSLEDTTISDNTSTGGGGTSAFGAGAGVETAGHATITSSTISGNQSDIFAGAYAYSATVTNSTISGNTAFQAVAGIGTGYASIFNSTIVLNHVQLDNLTYPAGLFARSRGELQSTIVFGNALGTTAFDVGGAGGSFFGANNLVGFSPVTLPVGTLHDDPLLGPLQNNGGNVATHALLPGSPAIDTGNNAAGLANDERGPGFPRVSGAAADIGAFEVQAIGDRIFADGFDGL